MKKDLIPGCKGSLAAAFPLPFPFLDALLLPLPLALGGILDLGKCHLSGQEAERARTRHDGEENAAGKQVLITVPETGNINKDLKVVVVKPREAFW